MPSPMAVEQFDAPFLVGTCPFEIIGDRRGVPDGRPGSGVLKRRPHSLHGLLKSRCSRGVAEAELSCLELRLPAAREVAKGILSSRLLRAVHWIGNVVLPAGELGAVPRSNTCSSA